MNQKSGRSKDAADKLVKGIKRKTRKQYSVEEKIRNVLAAWLPFTVRRALPLRMRGQSSVFDRDTISWVFDSSWISDVLTTIGS